MPRELLVKSAPATARQTVSPQPKPPGLFPQIDLHLAYLEPGADRTEYTVPSGGQVFVAKNPFTSVLDGVVARVIQDSSGKDQAMSSKIL